jgi:hypothetical protein
VNTPDLIATTCKECHRCVYTIHLDHDGYCCFCTTKPHQIEQPEATGPKMAGGASVASLVSEDASGKKPKK